MRILHILSPKRLIGFMAGHDPVGDVGVHPSLHGLNDHYLRDIGFRRERQTGRRPLLHPWMM
jgi:hypothetical protein